MMFSYSGRVPSREIVHFYEITERYSYKQGRVFAAGSMTEFKRVCRLWGYEYRLRHANTLRATGRVEIVCRAPSSPFLKTLHVIAQPVSGESANGR